jgi:magnesium chelatase family protein
MPIIAPHSQPTTQTFNAIHGHDSIKKACAYSIIGGHPMLLIGSPGIGKTMLIDHMKTLLPRMSHWQAIENACIQSFIEPHFEFTTTPPFRAPHHSISYAGMLGGKNPPQPGEITRANHGVLFLDELGEYQRAILDTLREPLESHCIQVSRAGSSTTYPANFLLIAAMNPCYCGYYFDQTHPCGCSPQHIKRYWKKISQPLLDRISICCILSKPKKSQSSVLHQDLVAMIDNGKSIAFKRNPDKKNNQSLSHHELLDVFDILDDAQSQLDAFIDAQQLSMRGQLRIKKLTRTIADANASTRIKKEHALHAIQLSQHQQLPN